MRLSQTFALVMIMLFASLVSPAQVSGGAPPAGGGKGAGGGFGGAGGSAPPTLPQLPTSLDGMIAAALRSNPDVLMAEAKVRLAEAELNQVRLKVAREVIALNNDREKQRMALEQAEIKFKMASEAHAAGGVSNSEVLGARFAIQQAQMDLSQLEAGVRYMLGAAGVNLGAGRGTVTDATGGMGGGATDAGPKSPPKPARVPRPPIPADLRDGPLAAKVTASVKDSPLRDVLDLLTKQSGVTFVLHRAAEQDAGLADVRITNASPAPVTLSAFLHMMADQFDLTFIFRDYGVLVTIPGMAEPLDGPAIPDAMQLDR